MVTIQGSLPFALRVKPRDTDAGEDSVVTRMAPVSKEHAQTLER
jgi:hypothetical protein